jgi:Fe-S-cluster containining protein
MLAKNPPLSLTPVIGPSPSVGSTTATPTSYSFEQILGWFGKFTPQFKFQLLATRRALDSATFDSLIRETLSVFRMLLTDLARFPKGPERARRVFALIDGEYKVSPPQAVSCAAGCASCCKSFPKQITNDEADLLALLVNTGAAQIDRAILDEQVRNLTSSDPSRKTSGAKSVCVFLGEGDRCSIYADRPGVCRKYHVVSPPSACESESDGVIPQIELMPELIVSAAMSLPDNGIGLMPLQIASRLK